jgi:hypothetical protein
VDWNELIRIHPMTNELQKNGFGCDPLSFPCWTPNVVHNVFFQCSCHRSLLAWIFLSVHVNISCKKKKINSMHWSPFGQS